MNDAQQRTPHQPQNYAKAKAEAQGEALGMAGSMFLLGSVPAIAFIFADVPDLYVYLFDAVWVVGMIVPATLTWLGSRR